MDKFVMLFPGQGSQYVGMGSKLYNEFSIVKVTYEEANDVLGYDLRHLCFEGRVGDLNKIENMLVAILTASVAFYRLFAQEIGVTPQYLMGHSLGELSALTCSGAIDFCNALEIVRLRSIFAAEDAAEANGTMSVISGISADTVEEECNRVSEDTNTVSIACYNSLNQVVISGHQDAVMKVEDRLLNQDAQITPLIMSPPFHSPLLLNAANRLKAELNKIKFKELSIPVISNVTARQYKGPNEIVDNLTSQLVSPVQWCASLEYIKQLGIYTAIEIGPQSLLTNLIQESSTGIKSYAFDNLEDRKTLFEKYSKRSKNISYEQSYLNTNNGINIITKCLATAVCTKNSNWDEGEYYEGVIKPYEGLEKLKSEICNGNIVFNYEQINRSLKLLKMILDTKKVHSSIQLKKFIQIIDETGIGDLKQDIINDLFKLDSEGQTGL